MLDPTAANKIKDTYEEQKAKGTFYTHAPIDEYLAAFRSKFGPEILRQLDGKELLTKLHGSLGNKGNSLAYWLEFKNDDEFRTVQFGSIKGGDALKFGVYVDAATGEWKSGYGQNRYVISEQEVVEMAREQRDQLLRGCDLLEAFPTDGTDADYVDLQERLLKEAPKVYDTAWGHKYFFLMFPDKLDDFHVERNHRFNIIKLLQIPPEQSGRYTGAGRYIAAAKELGLTIYQLTYTLCYMDCTPRRYWRIGTRAGDTRKSYWELMRDGDYVSIGWRELGNLSSYVEGQQSKEHIKQLLNDRFYSSKRSVAGKKSTEIFQFIKTIADGDLVIASDGERVLGVGKVTGPYVYDEQLDFPHCRHVEWLNLGEWKMPISEGLLTTVHEVYKPENLVEIERHVYEGRGPRRRYWVEKTLVKGRERRMRGEYALGKALTSPQTSSDGRDIYAAMREVQPGDIILHLIDNDNFSGVSIAESSADSSFTGLEDSDYAGMPGYLIRLKDYTPLEAPLRRDKFLNDPAIFEQLERILQTHKGHGLFYNREHNLNQGAYLTEAPTELVRVLNSVYCEKTGHPLPHVDMPCTPTPHPSPHTINKSYTLADLIEETGFDVALVDKWIRTLNRKKQVIVQGPPGTGKTYLAERLARFLISETTGLYEVIQFHPSYAYEDFIQGIRPSVEGSALSYEVRDGRFLEFCAKAKERSDAACVLIIDEINRANLSRVFGELMYLLEYRNDSIPLAYGGDLSIPNNVYLIGTMNTADRSIALVDHALRRRFTWIYLAPDYDVLECYLNKYDLPADSLRSVLENINATIDDPHYALGISFFLKDGARLKETIQDVWEGEIEPYLEEYFYDRPEKIEPFRWANLIDAGLAAWKPEGASSETSDFESI